MRSLTTNIFELPSFTGELVILLPVRPEDYPEIDAWILTGGSLFWENRAQTFQTYEQYVETIAEAGASEHLAVFKSRTSGRCLGLILAKELYSGYGIAHVEAYASAACGPDEGFESGLLFVDYLMKAFSLRKVYYDLLGDEDPLETTRFRQLLRTEGRLRDHLVVDGRSADLAIAALSRTAWTKMKRSRRPLSS